MLKAVFLFFLYSPALFAMCEIFDAPSISISRINTIYESVLRQKGEPKMAAALAFTAGLGGQSLKEVLSNFHATGQSGKAAVLLAYISAKTKTDIEIINRTFRSIPYDANASALMTYLQIVLGADSSALQALYPRAMGTSTTAVLLAYTSWLSKTPIEKINQTFRQHAHGDESVAVVLTYLHYSLKIDIRELNTLYVWSPGRPSEAIILTYGAVLARLDADKLLRLYRLAEGTGVGKALLTYWALVYGEKLPALNATFLKASGDEETKAILTAAAHVHRNTEMLDPFLFLLEWF